MSGHSKWSTIKRKKGAADVKRSALFTKLAKGIEVAARGSGGNPDLNFRLKLAIQKAKGSNMPTSSIDKAIKKGTGEDKAAALIEEATYEGLGAGNVAVVVSAMTDNKNRTVAELRNIFNKAGATFGTPVAWQFDNRGILRVKKSGDLEALELAAIEAGALEIDDTGDELEITTLPKELDKIKTALESAGYKVAEAELGLVPKQRVTITDPVSAQKILNFLDALEDHEDVGQVFSTLDVPDEVLEKLRMNNEE
ncbi:YebC/PmpR family DNA-binding transcriptional regulator [Patescibacteria group bacterium]|nr:YebC/PmpR family DNA-binding transcriptional regulator [Patescibacteria group bacterium]